MQVLRHVALGTAVALTLALTSTRVDASGPYRGKEYYARPFSWTGFYIGAVASHVWGDSKHCDDQTCNAPGVTYPDFDLRGWMGGITAGYNFQRGNVVAGVEVDWSWGSADGSSPSTPTFGCLGSCDTDVRSIGTARVRLGYAMDRLLPFLTAGVAFTRYEASIGSPGVVARDRTTETSFVGGGGLEYAFGANWSGKIEYLYIGKLGDFDYDTGVACGAPPGNCFSRTDPIHTVRIGLNYRF